MFTPVRVLVGLGNPGASYELTRHNAGKRWIQALATRFAIPLRLDQKRKVELGRGVILGHDVRLIAPTTYMNLSGDAVGPFLRYFAIEPIETVVAFDEVAFEVGVTKLKIGGSAGGHNGIRSIISSLGGDRQFGRLRIGVGHPGNPSKMIPFLTGESMPAIDREVAAASSALNDETLSWLLDGDWQRAMTRLHSASE